MASKRQKWNDDMMPVCNRCKKEAPVRADMSDENWTVYDTSKPCECGGNFVARFMLEGENGE